MELKNFRFKTKKNNVLLLMKNPILNNLEKFIEIDQATFELATNYFLHYVHNEDSLTTVSSFFETEKDLLAFELGLNTNSGWMKELIKYLSKIHLTLDINEFKFIRNSYIEFIVCKWKNFFGKKRNVYIEPQIFHKRKFLFEKSDFCNSVCDVVHRDVSEKKIEIYECKTTMKLFVSFLADDEANHTESKIKKSIRKAKRKQDYMTSFLNLFKKNTDAESVEVAYITLSNKNDLPKKINDIIPIYTRELFSENYFQIFNKQVI